MLKRLLSFFSRAPGTTSPSSPSSLGGPGWPNQIRFVVLAVVIAGSVPLILSSVDEHYPVHEWLFWRYAAYWGWMALFSASCLSTGHLLASWIQPRRPPVAEHLVTSFALGVFTFFIGMVIAGWLGLYNVWFAIAWPLVMLAAGAWRLLRYLRRLARHWKWLRAQPRPATAAWRWIVFAYGVVGVVAIIFVTLTPKNISYDACWYHLSVAEHYAAHGGIERFHEGWFQGTNPQLSSFLYTWGFILPWSRVVDRAMTCAQLEVTLFLWTLAALPPVVRRLLRGRRSPLAWVVMFLFPGIFLYDSNLSVGADHIGAFWAIPIVLTLLRAWEEPRPRRLLMLAVFVSAAALTKYTVIILAVGPILAMVLRSCWVGIAGFIKKTPKLAISAWTGLATFALAGVLLTTPHWLKNWIWHGDPAYPLLYKHFAGNPWTPDSAAFYGIGIGDRLLAPQGTFFEKASKTLPVLFTFAFEPHNWPQFHQDTPVFGFLFTISTLMLVAFKRSARVWGVVLCSWIGIATWLSIHPRDRYLQSILPWLVAVTAAVLVMAWRSHWIHRVLLSALIALQIIWGGDVYFIRTHAMIHDSPIKNVVNLMAAGFEKKYDTRLQRFGHIESMGETLPADAKVLVHEEHMTLGLQRRRVNDAPGLQGGLIYGRLKSVRDLYQVLTGWGVNYVAWIDQKSSSIDSIGGDLLFFDFVNNYTVETEEFSTWRLARLPLAPPTEPLDQNVAYFACNAGYEKGLYRRSAMTVPGRPSAPVKYPKPDIPLGTDGATVESLIQQARYVVWNSKCLPSLDLTLLSGFQRAGRRDNVTELYVRQSNEQRQPVDPAEGPHPLIRTDRIPTPSTSASN